MPGVVECLKIVTREESYRVAKLAFDYATKHGRKKVLTPTTIHINIFDQETWYMWYMYDLTCSK